jgi:hypothetical protein
MSWPAPPRGRRRPTAFQDIVAFVAPQTVRSGAADKQVVSLLAPEVVVVFVPVEGIGKGGAADIQNIMQLVADGVVPSRAIPLTCSTLFRSISTARLSA